MSTRHYSPSARNEESHTTSTLLKKRTYTQRRAKMLSKEQKEQDKNVKIACNNKREKFHSVKAMMKEHNKWIQFRKGQIESGTLSAPEKKKTINAIQSMKTRIKNALEQEFLSNKLEVYEQRIQAMVDVVAQTYNKMDKASQNKINGLIGNTMAPPLQSKQTVRTELNQYFKYDMSHFLQ